MVLRNKKIIIDIIFYAIAIIIIIFCSNIIYSTINNSQLNLKCVVNFNDLKNNTIKVVIDVDNINKPLLIFRPQTSLLYLRISNFNTYCLNKKHIPYFKIGQFYFLFTGFSKGIKIQYHVHPGVPGRHGLQGYKDDRFALLDGRLLFLVPLKEKHVIGLHKTSS